MNKNTKKIFDRGLFREAVRNTKVIGILECILLSVVPLLLYGAISLTMRYSQPYYDPTPMSLSFLQFDAFLYASFLLFTPILAGKLFGFLNRRTACDFYHAIPQTRLCLFFCQYLALLFWSILAIVLNTLCVSAFALLSPIVEITSWAAVVPTMFGMLAGVVLVSGAIILAITITGTPLMNVVVTFMILFLPRVLLTVFRMLMLNNLPLLVEEHFLPGLRFMLQNNILCTIYSGTVEQWQAVLYTLLLGLLYLVLAGFFFYRRRSEAAGQSAQSRAMQAVFRLIFSGALSLIPISLIASIWMNEREELSMAMPLLIVIYVFVVIGYFLFELITTRKPSNLLKIFPGLAVLAVLNAAAVFGICGGAELAMNFAPSADKIDSVCIELQYNSYFDDSYAKFITPQISQIRFTDAQLKSTLAQALEKSVNSIRLSSTSSTYRIYQFEEDVRNYYYDCDYRIVVGMQCGSRMVYRKIALTQSDYQTVIRAFEECPAIRESYANLPAAESLNYMAMSDINSYDTVCQIYESLRADMQTASFDENFATMTGDREDKYETIASIRIALSNQSETAVLYIPLLNSPSYRNTVDLYRKITAEMTKNAADQTLRHLQSCRDTANIWMGFYDSDGTYADLEIDYDSFSAEDAHALADYLKTHATIGIEADKPYLIVHYYDEDNQYDVTFSVDDIHELPLPLIDTSSDAEV